MKKILLSENQEHFLTECRIHYAYAPNTERAKWLLTIIDELYARLSECECEEEDPRDEDPYAGFPFL